MGVVGNFVNEYGAGILYTALTAIAGYLGLWAKGLYTRYVNTREKKDAAKTCVMAVEQLYKDLHGADKLQKAMELAAEMLNDKGITVNEVELHVLIEAAVGEFNGAFLKTS